MMDSKHCRPKFDEEAFSKEVFEMIENELTTALQSLQAQIKIKRRDKLEEVQTQTFCVLRSDANQFRAFCSQFVFPELLSLPNPILLTEEDALLKQFQLTLTALQSSTRRNAMLSSFVEPLERKLDVMRRIPLLVTTTTTPWCTGRIQRTEEKIRRVKRRLHQSSCGVDETSPSKQSTAVLQNLHNALSVQN